MIYDVVISGAGICGMLLALGLKSKGLNVIVLEQSNKAPEDPRTIAISYSSTKILQSIELWQKLEPYAAPINDILISSEDSRSAFIHYDNELVMGMPMGYTVPGNKIREALNSFSIKKAVSEKCVDFEEDNSGVTAILESGKSVRGKLLVIAEGKHSSCAEKLEISTHKFDYQQSCIITTLTHKQKHNNLATELFCKGGPFALLPTADPHKSGLIWTEKQLMVDEITKATKSKVLKALNARCDLTITDFEPMLHYPVSLAFVTKYYRGKVLLFGDALHSIHPVAGQGLNLAIGDLKVFMQSTDMGLGSDVMLRYFFRQCLLKNFSMIAMTDFLVRIFAKSNCVIKFTRNLAMALVNESDFAKQFFIRRAMGI